MHNIINDIAKYKSISIIGNYKNVGKTTTLNYIIDGARDNIVLGLTSIGVDGEEEDVVTKTHKPRVYVNKGTIIATAKACALKSDITKEILDVTNINTPMGKVVILKALSDGYVELAGPSINSQTKDICSRLNQLGANTVIVDGALSRKTMASPSITEATLFCTGAVLSTSMEKVVDLTVHEFNMLNMLKVNDQSFYNLYNEYLTDAKISIVNDKYDYKKLDAKTTLGVNKDLIDSLNENSKYLVINGIVVNSFIENLIKSTDKYKNFTILVKDGTKVFLDKDIYQKFIKLGGSIKVIDKINIIGISVNPVSIKGYSFESDKFINQIQQYIDLPVFNVIGGDKN